MFTSFQKLIIPVALLLVLSGCQDTTLPTTSTTATEEASVRSVINGFGRSLQQVTVSAPKDVAAQSIKDVYSSYLTPELVTLWSNDPTIALGKITSSPWPDRIDITQLVKVSDNQYEVDGNVIQVTSSDLANGTTTGQDPVELTVKRNNATWLISNVVTPEPVPTTALEDYDQDGVIVQYTEGLKVESGKNLGGANLDTSLVRFLIPKAVVTEDNQPTNFNEAYVVISKSSNANMVRNCTTFSDMDNTTGQVNNQTIHDVVFAQKDAADAGAGNFYKSKLYRTVHKNTCYELALVIHTSNVNNYDPPVTEFDQNKALALLNPIVNSFQFND